MIIPEEAVSNSKKKKKKKTECKSFVVSDIGRPIVIVKYQTEYQLACIPDGEVWNCTWPNVHAYNMSSAANLKIIVIVKE